jgi:hypothetical protein
MEMPAEVDLPDEAVEAGLESAEERPEVVMASMRAPGDGDGGGGRDWKNLGGGGGVGGSELLGF